MVVVVKLTTQKKRYYKGVAQRWMHPANFKSDELKKIENIPDQVISIVYDSFYTSYFIFTSCELKK